MVVDVAIRTANPALADYRPHGRLLVMPKDAPAAGGTVQPPDGPEKPLTVQAGQIAVEDTREPGVYTLRHAAEIRSMDAIDELADMPASVKPDEVKLARQVMGTFEGDVDLQEYRDDYQVGLREIIDAKIEGREIVMQEVEAPPKVVNLMEALRKSLDTISASKKKPAAPVERMAASAPKKRARA